jgi:hypothetical protein
MKRFILLLVVLFCGGCSLFTKGKLADWASFPSVSEQEQKCLVKAVSDQQHSINTFRGLIAATIAVGRAKYNLRQIAIFERPNNSRIEILQPGLNQTASIVVTRDGELVAYSALKKVGYRGQANIENYYRLLGLPMSTDELMMWLSGTVVSAGNVSFYYNNEMYSYLAVSRDDKREMRTEFEIEKGQICGNPQLKIRALEIDYEGDLLFSSQFQYAGNELELIKFYLEEVDLSGELKLQHVGRNFDVSTKREKLFYFDLPSGATIKQIEDLNQDNILLPGN